MGKDPKTYQEYLFKYQCYLMKVRDSFEDLPCNNGYKTLDLIFYKKASFEDGIYINQVTPALHGIARIASHNAVYIQQKSGVPARKWKSKLTDHERAIRMAGLYSHRPIKAFVCDNFSDGFESYIINTFPEVPRDQIDRFLEDSKQELNSYFYDLWHGEPNRKEDLEKLKTLLKQTEKVIDKVDLLVEMVLDNDCIDCLYDKENFKKYMPVIWKLFHCTQEAIARIKSEKDNYKQLETNFIAELALNYKVYLKLEPSPDVRRGKFMDFISGIEDEIDLITRSSTRKKNRFGRLVVSKAILKSKSL